MTGIVIAVEPHMQLEDQDIYLKDSAMQQSEFEIEQYQMQSKLGSGDGDDLLARQEDFVSPVWIQG